MSIDKNKVIKILEKQLKAFEDSDNDIKRSELTAINIELMLHSNMIGRVLTENLLTIFEGEE